jgi:lysylphosphatidylglycerol synthetase-like protein (DUF2156 family)
MVLKALLFVLFAVPGLLLFMVSAFQLFVSAYDPAASDVQVNPLLLLVTTSVGGLMMLAGVGLWGQWRYLFVFAVIPSSLFLVITFNPRGPGASLSIAAVVVLCTFTVLHFVRRHYRKQSQNLDNHSDPRPTVDNQ